MSKISAVAAAAILETPPIYFSRQALDTGVWKWDFGDNGGPRVLRSTSSGEVAFTTDLTISGSGVVRGVCWDPINVNMDCEVQVWIDGVMVWDMANLVPPASTYWYHMCPFIFDGAIPFAESFVCKSKNVGTGGGGLSLVVPYRLN